MGSNNLKYSILFTLINGIGYIYIYISNFIIFSLFSLNYSGFIYVLIILIILVSELCIGLAIIIRLLKFKNNLKNSYLNKINF